MNSKQQYFSKKTPPVSHFTGGHMENWVPLVAREHVPYAAFQKIIILPNSLKVLSEMTFSHFTQQGSYCLCKETYKCTFFKQVVLSVSLSVLKNYIKMC